MTCKACFRQSVVQLPYRTFRDLLSVDRQEDPSPAVRQQQRCLADRPTEKRGSTGELVCALTRQLLIGSLQCGVGTADRDDMRKPECHLGARPMERLATPLPAGSPVRAQARPDLRQGES